MKSTILKAATFAAAAIVFSVSPLMAQYKDMKLTIDVPFSFDASGRTIEAGKFQVRRAATTAAMVVMTSGAGSSFAVVTQASGHPRAKSSMRFHKYGNTWFLRAIQESGHSVVLVLPRSARLKEIERAAGGQAEPVEVAVLSASTGSAAAALE